MATSVMQIRVDDELRAEAAAIYDELGLDLPTAIRIFLKRSVAVQGIPFSMMLQKADYRAEQALCAVQNISDTASINGTSGMSLEEINAEIQAVRNDRAVRKAQLH